MKVTRSYWLGLGSGFILSAMLAVAITSLQGQALNTNHAQTSQNSQTQTNAIPQNSQTNQTLSSGIPTKPQDALPSADSNSIERNFVIRQGATLEQIADQLVAQGFIKNKADFLSVAHQMGVEVKFKVGTFKLLLGLTPEEVIHRLVKS